MKNLLLLIALVVLTVQGVAQESSKKKNEIGINVFSIMDGRVSETSAHNFRYLYEFYPTFLFATGITYKHHSGKNSFRVSLDYYYDKYENVKIIENPEELETTFRVESRTGYQRNFGTQKIKPYLAIDLLISAQKRYELYDGGLGFYHFEYTTYLYNIGLGPAIGLQYQITKRISVAVEINTEFRGNLIYINDKIQGDGMYVAFNPIRLLSINYHF